jgi:glycerol-3-phosphate acyltransferase PlsX
MKIAVDAMGGDNAPHDVVEGAVMAVRDHGMSIVLVGEEDKIQSEISRVNGRLGEPERGKLQQLEIHHASQIIGMGESPATAYKRKQDSSIVQAARLVGEKKAEAMVSAGNTGACMTAAFLKMGALEGVQRPAIALAAPHAQGFTTIIDVGANVDCKPIHLLQFAIMGDVYTELVLGINRPRVGLLNVGEEEGKGNELTQKTHELLRQTNLNFIGNIEGRDILRGNADVIVCDGFVGNIILKFGEGMAEVLTDVVRDIFSKSGYLRQLGGWLSRPVFRKLKWLFSPSRVGGAPLLGVDGTCIIGHGISSAQAISSAIQEAEKMVSLKVNEKIQERLNSLDLARGNSE